MTDRQANALLGAYLERKKFEAKITVSVVGEALTKKKDDGPMSLTELAAMGFAIE